MEVSAQGPSKALMWMVCLVSGGEITKFEAACKEWIKLHTKCKIACEVYVEKDAKCNCEQARCELANCAGDTCVVCEDVYQRCWAGCDREKDGTDKEEECLEKDRKIDWSATENMSGSTGQRETIILARV